MEEAINAKVLKYCRCASKDNLLHPKLGNTAWRTSKLTTGSMWSLRSSMPSTVLRGDLGIVALKKMALKAGGQGIQAGAGVS